MSTPRITEDMVRGEAERAIFKAEWPKGAEVTIENVHRALVLGLDLSWGTGWFTPDVLAEYKRQKAPLLAEYDRQTAPLWAEYQRKVAPLMAEYYRQAAPLLAEYYRQVAPLWVEAFLKSLEGTE